MPQSGRESNETQTKYFLKRNLQNWNKLPLKPIVMLCTLWRLPPFFLNCWAGKERNLGLHLHLQRRRWSFAESMLRQEGREQSHRGDAKLSVLSKFDRILCWISLLQKKKKNPWDLFIIKQSLPVPKSWHGQQHQECLEWHPTLTSKPRDGARMPSLSSYWGQV